MESNDQQAALAALRKMLRPLVRLLIRLQVPFGSFVEVVKQVYVSVADEAFALDGRKQTHSRVAVITGLTRKEVARIRQLPNQIDSPADAHVSRCSRVISGWLLDREFSEKGQPNPLSYEGAAGFKTLVLRYSGDMPARAVLDELMRIGAVERDPEGLLLLNKAAFIPTANMADQLAMLARDVNDLIETIEHNITRPALESRFQLKVEYDNLSRDAVDAFQALSDQQSMKLLRQYDEWLAQHDRDIHDNLPGSGRYRVGVGLYYFEETLCEDKVKEKES